MFEERMRMSENRNIDVGKYNVEECSLQTWKNVVYKDLLSLRLN